MIIDYAIFYQYFMEVTAMIGWIIAGSIIGAIVIILIISVIVMYNNLVERSVRVDNAWSQIDVQMKQRYDLIPNLVETVKAYASHEKSTLEEVTKWRAAAMEAKTPEELMKSNQKLSGAIANIFATAENYPDLKANALKLRVVLAGFTGVYHFQQGGEVHFFCRGLIPDVADKRGVEQPFRLHPKIFC